MGQSSPFTAAFNSWGGFDLQFRFISFSLDLSFARSLLLNLSCKIFEHFALQADPVTEFVKLGSIPFKDGTTLAPKLVFRFEEAAPPPLNTGSSKPNPDQLIFCTT